MSAAVNANGAPAGAAASGSLDARLRDLTQTLAARQAPDMPSWVAARIDRALAAESARRNADDR